TTSGCSAASRPVGLWVTDMVGTAIPPRYTRLQGARTSLAPDAVTRFVSALPATVVHVSRHSHCGERDGQCTDTEQSAGDHVGQVVHASIHAGEADEADEGRRHQERDEAQRPPLRPSG